MTRLLTVLTAVAAAFFWSASALAYRVEFLNMHDGQRVAGSEVCFFASATVHNPFGHFLSSNDVRCLPADHVIDLPAGQWNFFGRSGKTLTSAAPALLQIPANSAESGYRAAPIELRLAGTLDVAAVRKTLAADESLVIFLPMPFGAGSNARPVAPGEDEVLVPAGTPLIPLVVRDTRPVRVGDVVRVDAGERRSAVFTPPAAGTGDVVIWIGMEVDFAGVVDGDAPFAAPSIALLTGKDQRQPVLPPRYATNLHRALQVFRGVPAGPARVAIRDEAWQLSEVPFVVPDGGLVTADEALSLIPAGVVTVQWQIEGDPAGSPSLPRQTCDGPSNPPTRTSRVAPRLRLLRCDASAPESECLVAFERELPPDASSGSAAIGSLDPRIYVAELHAPPFAPVRYEVYAAAGKRVDVELVAAPATIYGTVTREGKPVRAALAFGRESFATDASGAFAAAISRTIGQTPVIVTPCDTKDPFIYRPPAPLEPNAFVAIDIPDRSLAVRVVARGGAEIDEAKVTLAIPEPGQPEVARSVRTLRRDAERALYVLPQFAAEESHVCASAVGYGQRCVDLRRDYDPSEPLEIALEKTTGIRGRIVTEAAIVSGVVFVISPGGDVLARSNITSEGAFEIPMMPPPGSHYVLTANNQPLSALTLDTPPAGEGLLLRVPATRPRHFAVRIAPGLGIDRGRLTITVGMVPIPTEVFEIHQQLHGQGLMLDGAHPLMVSSVAENGAIRVQLIPLAPLDRGTPPLAGTLPGESDLLLLR